MRYIIAVLGKLLCRLGRHKWGAWCWATTYSFFWAIFSDNPWVDIKVRQCEVCGKIEYDHFPKNDGWRNCRCSEEVPCDTSWRRC